MQTSTLIAIGVVLAIGGAVAAIAAKRGGKPKKGAITARQPVTKAEQAMYWRLAEAFPAPISIHCQMSFGALLNAKAGASRTSFAMKRADFVLMDKAFTVLAVIELDDSTHKNKANADEARAGMLTNAGYRLFRYPRIPSVETLRTDIAGQLE